MRYKVYFFGIILLALLLRTINLGIFPNGLNSNEAIVGWRAQNLLNFGKDEFGRNFPVYFSNSSGIEMPLTTYITLPFIAVSKTDVSLLRLPFALLGVLLVVGGMLLAKRLFPEQKNIGLWTGLILAISPSLVWFSRVVNPQIVAFNLIIWGCLLIYSKKFKILGSLLLGFSVTALPDIFLFTIFITILLFWKNKNYKNLLPTILILVIFLIFMLTNKLMLASWVESNLSLIKDSPVLDDINLIRGHNLTQGLPNILNSLFFNKTYYLVLVLKNFLTYLNPSYIFAKGDGIIMNGFSNFGLVPIVTLPVFLLGLYKLINKLENKKVVLGWFIISTVSSLFLSTTPNTGKFIFAIFPVSILIGLGVLHLNKFTKWIFLILLFFNLGIMIHDAATKENQRQESIFFSQTPNLINFIKENTSGNVWVTDGIDQNLISKIGYYGQVPYDRSSLPEDPVNIYKQRAKRINNIHVGFKEDLERNPKNFEYILKSPEEKHYGCFREKLSFGQDDKKYVLLARVQCQNETP